MVSVKQNQLHPSAKAYENAVYDVARRKGFGLSNVVVHLDKGYAVATDLSGYPYKVKLLPKSVARFGAWTAMTKNPTSTQVKRCKKILDEAGDLEGLTFGNEEKIDFDVTRRNPRKTYYTEIRKSLTRFLKGGAPIKSGNDTTDALYLLEHEKSLLTESEYKKLKQYVTDYYKQKQNPHGFVIVDSHLNIQMRSSNYDKLQDTVDRHNEKYDDNKWFVVDESDIKEMKQPKRRSKNTARKTVNPRTRQMFKVALTDGSNLNILALSQKAAENIVAKQAKREKWTEFPSGKPLTVIKSNPNTNGGEVFNESKLDELSGIFQGAINGRTIKTVGSDYTPSLTSRLGKLVKMIVKNGRDTYEIDFSGDAYLSADARKNLYIEGRKAKINGVEKPPKGALHLLGEVQQIHYVTNKKHIENGQTVEYYHELGEVDGVKPNAFIDHDAFPILIGGGYDIGINGIEN